MVDILLAHGPDLTARDDDGQTALRLAGANGHLRVVRRLREAGSPL